MSLSKIQMKYFWESSAMFCWYCYNGFSFLFHLINRFLPNDNIEVFKYSMLDTFISVFFKSILAKKLEPLLF